LNLNKNQTVASGKVLNFIDILKGSGGSKEFNWLIIGEAGDPVNISVGSPMTGEFVKTVILK